MKKLAIKVLLLAAPFLVAYIYVEHQLSKIPNSYSLKRKYLEEQLNKIEVLQLGPSQTLFGVNPEYFSHYGFNLSNVSQSLYYDTRLAMKYMDSMPSLRLIIVSVSYYSFRYQLTYSKENWREFYYYAYWDIDDPRLSYFKPERYSKISLYNINEVQKYMRANFKVNLAPDLRYNGYQKTILVDKYNQISDTFGKYWVQRHNSFMDEKEVKNNYNDVKNLLELAGKKNIKVVFITTPVPSTYYKYVIPGIIAEKDSILNEFASKYNTKYFNYFTDDRFVVGDFLNNDHLNYIGAKKFSKILDSEVIKPLIGN